MLTMSQPILRTFNNNNNNAHSQINNFNQAPTTTATTTNNLIYNLEVVQHPIQARAMGWGSKADSRRPVDPPPVINLLILNELNENITHHITNNFVLHTSLIDVDNNNDNSSNVQNRLTGTTMYSLTHLRAPSPGKFFFLLHDLSIRQEGRYKLLFNVYEIMSSYGVIKHRAQTTSNIITVYSPKTFPGLESSSDLVKEIASQGCKVRVRKESTSKRKRHSKSYSASLISNNSHANEMLFNDINYYQTHQQQHTIPEQQQQNNASFYHHNYYTTPMMKSSSESNSSLESNNNNNYYRGYDSLLMAAAVNDNNGNNIPPQASLPPTPSTGIPAYDHRYYPQPPPPPPPPPQQQQQPVIRNQFQQPIPTRQAIPMPPPSPAQSPPPPQERHLSLPTNTTATMKTDPTNQIDPYGMYLQRAHSDLSSSPTLPPPHQLIYDNNSSNNYHDMYK